MNPGYLASLPATINHTRQFAAECVDQDGFVVVYGPSEMCESISTSISCQAGLRVRCVVLENAHITRTDAKIHLHLDAPRIVGSVYFNHPSKGYYVGDVPRLHLGWTKHHPFWTRTTVCTRLDIDRIIAFFLCARSLYSLPVELREMILTFFLLNAFDTRSPSV